MGFYLGNMVTLSRQDKDSGRMGLEPIRSEVMKVAFSIEKDMAIIEAGGFWCSACLCAHPASEQSPKPRYCIKCYQRLKVETELAPAPVARQLRLEPKPQQKRHRKGAGVGKGKELPNTPLFSQLRASGKGLGSKPKPRKTALKKKPKKIKERNNVQHNI